MTTLIPKFDFKNGNATPDGAINRPISEKLEEWVSIKDFGAIGDGTTDDTTAIQDAHDFIVDSGQPGMLFFPSGTYKCTSGLTINTGYVSCFGQRAILNFSSITTTIACITFIGGNPYFGNPYNQADCVFEGFKIVGPGAALCAALVFDQLIVGSNLGPAHMTVRNCNITDFNDGVQILNHTYLVTFDCVDISNCYHGLYGINPVVDAGENIRFNNGTIYACFEAFKNSNGATTWNFYGTSFDYCSSSLLTIDTGQASFTGCHFETSTKCISATTNTITTFTGCYFLSVNDTQDKFIENNGFMTITGGRIATPDANTNIVYSTSRLTMVGTHIQSASATLYTIASGNYYVYLPNLNIVKTNAQINSSSSVIGTAFKSINYVTLTVLSTYVSLGVGDSSGLFTFRDETSGGVAVYAADSSGTIQIANSITGGFTMAYTGGQMSVRVTSGTVPRIISWSFVQNALSA
jgi:hypothetical protein